MISLSGQFPVCGVVLFALLPSISADRMRKPPTLMSLFHGNDMVDSWAVTFNSFFEVTVEARGYCPNAVVMQ